LVNLRPHPGALFAEGSGFQSATSNLGSKLDWGLAARSPDGARRFVRAAVLHDPPVYPWREIDQRFQDIARRNESLQAVCFRHGATKYNERNLVSGQHDTVLSATGERQAKAIAATLPDRLDLIVCSGLSRTVQTMVFSVPMRLRNSAPCFADPRLNEVNLGLLQGRRRAYLPEFGAGDLDFAPPMGESYRQAAQRVFSSIADIFDALAHIGGTSTAAIFCHGGVLRILSSLELSLKTSEAVFRVDVPNAEQVSLSSRNLCLHRFWLDSENHDAADFAGEYRRGGR
jgi:broad specificity phosphatase PhoE